MTFQREERYIVIKRSHLSADANIASEKERMLRDEMQNLGIDEVTDCVVVEQDWPEHDTIWRMIEARCGGRLFVPLGTFYDTVHAANVKAGWWTELSTGEPKRRNVGEMFILIVTELAEAFKAYMDDTMDDKLPQFHGLGVEMGDVEIRVADFMGALRAGRIVHHSRGTFNPGEDYFRQVMRYADMYEAIRKTPQAVGEPEHGDYMDALDPVEMIVAKLAFNASRADHKIENRMAEGGKRT